LKRRQTLRAHQYQRVGSGLLTPARHWPTVPASTGDHYCKQNRFGAAL